MHGEDVRQGEGRQAEGQHLAHGHIQQHGGEDAGDDDDDFGDEM
mgnify:CR=1 FL=1